MATKTSKKYVSSLLDQLKSLDVMTTRAYYEMGQLLHVFQEDMLYQIIGYVSFHEMVEEELSFHASTAANYAGMYRDFKRLHYNKTEALKLLNEYGMTNMRKVLSQESSKIGTLAVRHRIADFDENQINFTVTNAELIESQAALESMGAIYSDNGRYLNSSEAFMAMVHLVNSAPKQKAA